MGTNLVSFNFGIGLGFGLLLGVSSTLVTQYFNVGSMKRFVEDEFDCDVDSIKDVSVLDGPFKMVLVVNTSLKMDKGKIAAQAGHASVAAFYMAQHLTPLLLKLWSDTGSTKIAVKSTQEQLFKIADKAV